MSLYQYSRSSNQSSFRSFTPLSNEAIARYAPSVLASSAHESRGEKYTFIPTIEVIDGLRANGFTPFEVRQTRVRDQAKRDHTKHMVRLRHPDALGNGAEVPEIVLLNSHDGTSSYQLLSGVFRFVCSNGLIAGDIFNDVRVRHSGNVVDNVIEGSYRVLENVKEISSRIETYKSVQLDQEEQLALAEAAKVLRWDGQAPIANASQLLTVRRLEDRSNDAYTVFNRLQENLIRGGMEGRTRSGRRTSTRAVNGVNEDVRLNRALWTLMDRMVAYKTSEPELVAA